jgi:hypothetical protein
VAGRQGSIVRRSSGLRTCAGLSRGVRPTAEPLVAGWVGRKAKAALGRAGGLRGDAAVRPRGRGAHGANAPPPAPPWPCAARHGMEEEDQRQQRVARCACSCQNKEGRGEAASLFQIPSRQPNALRSVTGNLSEVGREGQRDRWRHGWRHRAPMDGFTACPAGPPPRPASSNPEPLLTLLLPLPLPAAGAPAAAAAKETP